MMRSRCLTWPIAASHNFTLLILQRRLFCPAYIPKSPRVLGLLKLPVLTASTSLRRSRKAGAARMDAG